MFPQAASLALCLAKSSFATCSRAALAQAAISLPAPHHQDHSIIIATCRASPSLSHGTARFGQFALLPSAARHFSAGAPKPEDVELHAGLKAKAMAKEYSFDLTYSPLYAESIKPQHRPPVLLREKLAYWAIQGARMTFDWVTGYKHDKVQTEAQWINRIIFLETVAGVPGMVAGVLRHLMSLRTMQRDNGWIHTMLEEAENERMHLLTFLKIRQPGPFFRFMVIMAQGVYFNLYFVSYMISPKFCHSIVGYLEEEAVRTYTHCLNDIDSGLLWKDTPAPEIGINYWKLAPDAKMRDLVLAVRADEACHSHVNHRLSELKMTDENPFAPASQGGQSEAKPAKAGEGKPHRAAA